ncbi:SDR family NAD(P)-dependent oxidoreductase [Streptomyces sp. NEAU-YJ-81]|uniref:SDR family NAD(P)-dependent oxidoreductase n=1 Tax=Streptomyces sp. NEAU-YJ-81 TaxID=2820288 RepID=UPI001ABCCE3D|nr:SDR family oxidoreductase [Streptomyces sp. NEAU-YJ-81]MBO3682237.1 SDR family oxidoreductase [Streptomyces sp. NEAU-YJ-81]
MDLTAPQSPAELFSLKGRTALVTGASSGLGACFALLLAEAGADVVATARRADRLAELRWLHPAIRPLPDDIDSPDDRRRIVTEAMGEATVSGRVDIVVNNAGMSGPLRVEEEEPDDVLRLLSVNLVAAYALTRDLVMAADPPSGMSVVNVASILGLVSGAPVGGAGYASSKAGLIGLTRELAGQWGRRGVRVNALAPGWFPSEMTAGLFADERSARWVERNTMVGRPGAEHELDTALLFLASPASSYCTGQVLAVDGGWTAR